MDRQEFCKLYDNLLFVPLEVRHPPVDPALLGKWCEESNDSVKLRTQNLSPEERMEKLREFNNTKNIFSFASIYSLTNGDGTFKQSFLNYFPDFVEWFESLTFIKKSPKDFRMGVLRQDTQEFIYRSDLHSHSPIHHDQPGTFGLRIYFNNNNNNMYMIPRKVPHEYYGEVDPKIKKDVYNDVLHKKDENGDIVMTDNGFPVPADEYHSVYLRARTPNKDTIFMLNDARCAHVVMKEYDVRPEHQDEKYTMLLLARNEHDDLFDWDELHKVIQQSIEKNSEYVVWWDDSDFTEKKN